uniref:Uncharacterized protein n=1 Tax=Desulfobacca acetoxidans TaxID=60893 RepID=A0A7C3WSG2_9BACT
MEVEVMKRSLAAVLLILLGWVAYPTNVIGQGSSLTMAQLENGTYKVGDKRITLKNGFYQEGSIEDGSYFLVAFVKAAIGDINSDGSNDAAVVYFVNTGGSGGAVVLTAIMNRNGTPVEIASVDLERYPEVKSISIKNGTIILNMLVHGPNDAECCPTVKQTSKYILAGNKLVLSR